MTGKDVKFSKAWVAAIVAVVMTLALPLSALAAENTATLEAGKAPIVAQGKKAKKVKKTSIKKASIIKIADQKYTGKPVMPKLKIRVIKKTLKNTQQTMPDGSKMQVCVVVGKKLKAGRDYTVTYKNNVEPGTAKAIVKGKGAYKDKRVMTFKIVAPDGPDKKWVVEKKRVKVGVKTVTKVVQEAYDAYEPQIKKTSVTFHNNRAFAVKGDSHLYYDKDPNRLTADKTPAWQDSTPLERHWDNYIFLEDTGGDTLKVIRDAASTEGGSVYAIKDAWNMYEMYSIDAPELWKKSTKNEKYWLFWSGWLEDCLRADYDPDRVVRYHSYWRNATEEELAKHKEEYTAIMDEIKYINGTTTCGQYHYEPRTTQFVVVGPDKLVHHDAVTKTETVDVYDTVEVGHWE